MTEEPTHSQRSWQRVILDPELALGFRHGNLHAVYMTNVSTNINKHVTLGLFIFGTASACTQRTLTTALWDAGTLCILISLYLLLRYIYHIQQCKNLKM